MNILRRTIAMLFAALLVLAAQAQKPKWVGNTPHELNKTYKFIEIVSTGSDLNSARADAVHLLAQHRQLTNAVQVSVETGKMTHIDQTTVNGEMNEKISDRIDINVKVSGQTYQLQACTVDEYVAGREHGRLRLHTLFMVAVCNNPVFDRTYLTTSYGAAPVVMSVIPGLGQWHKGSKGKAVAMFTAEAAAAASILVCENQRSSYARKAKEQPRFAKNYRSKADNWETGRNISIGVAAGIWIYNIIDAAAAKGARRLLVKRAGTSSFSVSPVVSPAASGVALTCNF